MPAVESRRRNSFLGSLALFTGLPALALAWFDFPGLPTVPVGPFQLRFVVALAAATLLLAVLSFLLASASKRTGTEIPLVAILVCGGALGLAYFRHRIPSLVPPQPAAPPAQAPVVAGKASPATTPNQKGSDPNRPPAVAAHAMNNARSAADAGAQAIQQQKARAAVRDARAKYDAARAAVVKSLESDPGYQMAKSDADAADERLRQARAALPPGHRDLVQISESALAAHDRLNQLIEAAMAKDPASLQARGQLSAALEAVRH